MEINSNLFSKMLHETHGFEAAVWLQTVFFPGGDGINR